MSGRLDAHLHFFRPGYVARHPEECRRVQPDEVTLYAALARLYSVDQVLAVGYEGADWAAGNNAYLAKLAATHPWIRPLAFAAAPEQLTAAGLDRWREQRFAGLSLYLFGPETEARLAQVPKEIWHWLTARRWLVSVNSRGEGWAAWRPVLERHPELRLLASHLGLPPAAAIPPSVEEARQRMDPLLSLARFPGVRVKLSGFYALTDPGYDYPHRAAWPYVERLLETYGPHRLLWGSDFSPSLEWVSFPQTFALLAEMPFLTADHRRRIEGGNLETLLAELREAV
jgi:L-fuconolactonase